MKKLYLFLFISQFCFAQADGYWDKDRITNQQIVVGAGERITVKSEDFPVGTTEILYRITLLNENQEMSNSLVSLLKSIPDPSGISQGSAGAVFLLSKIAGNDKCKYAIFTTEKDVLKYRENGDVAKACLVQSQVISKDAKLLSVNKSLCLTEQTQFVWFGFESKNWILNQKIILEIVPWVSNKKARGWNEFNKKSTIQTISKVDMDLKLQRNKLFLISILEKIEKNYSFVDFTELQNTEKSKIISDLSVEIFKEVSNNSKLFNQIRKDALQLFKEQKFDQAIDLLESTIISYNAPKASDLNMLGYFYMFSNQNLKALQYLEKAEKLDNANLGVQLNLAHVYLLSNQYAKAKAIYKKHKNQNIDAKTSFKSKAIQDFEDLEKSGIFSDDFKKVIEKLNDK